MYMISSVLNFSGSHAGINAIPFCNNTPIITCLARANINEFVGQALNIRAYDYRISQLEVSPLTKEKDETWGDDVSSFFRVLSQNFFSLPVVAALDQESIAKACNSDLLSDSCFEGMSLSMIEQMIEEKKRINDQEFEKVKGKDCIRILGYRYAGRKTFINYLHSPGCTIDVYGIHCDKEVAQAGKETKHLRTYPAQNMTDFDAETVFVDFPGILNHGHKKHPVEHQVDSMLNANGIIQVGELARTVVDIIIIDFQTFKNNKVDLGELKEAFRLGEPAANRILVISKVPPNIYPIKDVDDFPPCRDTLVEALKANGIHPSLADHVFLFDPADRNFHVNSTIREGGGTNRTTIIQAIRNRQKAAKEHQSDPAWHPIPASTEFLLTRTNNLNKLKGALRSAMENGNAAEKTNVFARLLSLTQVNFSPLNQVIRKVEKATNWEGEMTSSVTSFTEMLKTGETSSFWNHFSLKVLPFVDNTLFEKCFGEISQKYIDAIVREHHVHRNLKGSNVVQRFNQAFKDVIPGAQEKIADQLKQVLAQLDKYTSECEMRSVESVGHWMNTSEIFGMITVGDIFNKIEQLAERLRSVQKTYLDKHETLVNAKAIEVRNYLAVTLSLLLAYYIYRRCTSRSPGEEGEILRGYFGTLPIVEFEETDSMVSRGLRRCNIWERTDDGQSLRMISGPRREAKSDVLKLGRNQYVRLKVIHRVPSRQQTGYQNNNSNSIAMLVSSLIIAGSQSIVLQGALGISIVGAFTAFNQLAFDLLKRITVAAIINGPLIHKEACDFALK